MLNNIIFSLINGIRGKNKILYAVNDSKLNFIVPEDGLIFDLNWININHVKNLMKFYNKRLKIRQTNPIRLINI